MFDVWRLVSASLIRIVPLLNDTALLVRIPMHSRPFVFLHMQPGKVSEQFLYLTTLAGWLLSQSGSNFMVRFDVARW